MEPNTLAAGRSTTTLQTTNEHSQKGFLSSKLGQVFSGITTLVGAGSFVTGGLLVGGVVAAGTGLALTAGVPLLVLGGIIMLGLGATYAVHKVREHRAEQKAAESAPPPQGEHEEHIYDNVNQGPRGEGGEEIVYGELEFRPSAASRGRSDSTEETVYSNVALRPQESPIYAKVNKQRQPGRSSPTTYAEVDLSHTRAGRGSPTNEEAGAYSEVRFRQGSPSTLDEDNIYENV